MNPPVLVGNHVLFDEIHHIGSHSTTLHFNGLTASLYFYGKNPGTVNIYINGLLFKTCPIQTKVYLNIDDIVNSQTQDIEKRKIMKNFLTKGVPEELINYAVNLSLLSIVTVNSDCELLSVTTHTYKYIDNLIRIIE